MNFLQLLFASVIFNVTANIFLKKGVTLSGGISGRKSSVVSELLKTFFSPFVIAGLILYGLSFMIWLRVLSFNDLSRVYPIFVSFVFLLTTAGSAIFLRENISILRIIGILIILFGIYIVARS